MIVATQSYLPGSLRVAYPGWEGISDRMLDSIKQEEVLLHLMQLYALFAFLWYFPPGG